MENEEISWDEYDAAWLAMDEEFAEDYGVLYGTEANNYEDALYDQQWDLESQIAVL